jgi:hypothetical protein
MKNLSKCLKNSQVSAQTFEQELREFLKAYRATPHSSTGVAPNDLLFKPKPSTVGLPNTMDDIDMRARKNDKIAKAKQTAYANKRYRTKAHQFRVGDMVRLLQTVKGKSATTYFKMPFKIIALNGTMATIKRNGTEYARNVSMLKLVEPSTKRKVTQQSEYEMDATVNEEEGNVNVPPERLLTNEVGDMDLNQRNDDERPAETSSNAQEQQPSNPESSQNAQTRQRVEEERREAETAPPIVESAPQTSNSDARRSKRTTKGLGPPRLGINTIAEDEESSSDDFHSDEEANN